MLRSLWEWAAVWVWIHWPFPPDGEDDDRHGDPNITPGTGPHWCCRRCMTRNEANRENGTPV